LVPDHSSTAHSFCIHNILRQAQAKDSEQKNDAREMEEGILFSVDIDLLMKALDGRS